MRELIRKKIWFFNVVVTCSLYYQEIFTIAVVALRLQFHGTKDYRGIPSNRKAYIGNLKEKREAKAIWFLEEDYHSFEEKLGRSTKRPSKQHKRRNT